MQGGLTCGSLKRKEMWLLLSTALKGYPFLCVIITMGSRYISLLSYQVSNGLIWKNIEVQMHYLTFKCQIL